MFDKHMLCTDGFANIAQAGAVVGFCLNARLPYYRGIGLSMLEDLRLTVDGDVVERAAVSLCLRGRQWTLAQMESEYDARWNFGEIGQIRVARAGGLAAGAHVVRLTEQRRVSYLPFTPTTTDEKTLILEA